MAWVVRDANWQSLSLPWDRNVNRKSPKIVAIVVKSDWSPLAMVFKFSFFDREISGSPSNLSQSHPQKRIRLTEAIKRQINSFKSTNSPNSIIKTFFLFGLGWKKNKSKKIKLLSCFWNDKFWKKKMLRWPEQGIFLRLCWRPSMVNGNFQTG